MTELLGVSAVLGGIVVLMASGLAHGRTVAVLGGLGASLTLVGVLVLRGTGQV